MLKDFSAFSQMFQKKLICTVYRGELHLKICLGFGAESTSLGSEYRCAFGHSIALAITLLWLFQCIALHCLLQCIDHCSALSYFASICIVQCWSHYTERCWVTISAIECYQVHKNMKTSSEQNTTIFSTRQRSFRFNLNNIWKCTVVQCLSNRHSWASQLATYLKARHGHSAGLIDGQRICTTSISKWSLSDQMSQKAWLQESTSVPWPERVQNAPFKLCFARNRMLKMQPNNIVYMHQI